MKDIYTLLYSFAKEEYADDEVLLQLITIDYYLQHKIKPVGLLNAEVDASYKSNLIESNKLNHHKFRYVMLPIQFNWQEFVQYNHIIKDEGVFIIEYSGKDLPKIMDELVIKS